MIKKKFCLIASYLLFFITLNGCLQSTASLLGPSVAVAKTGNISQASLSYVSTNIIKEKIGKAPSEYVINLLTQNSHTNQAIHSIKSLNKKKNIKHSINHNSSEDEHQKFLVAVKKILK